MPYSIPAPAPAPLPIHSQGRPGHRRSFSEIAYSTTSIAPKSMPAPNPAPPRERQTSGAFAPLGSLPRRKPASFHLEADDDDDSSPEDEAGTNGPNRPQPTPRRISPNSSSSQINLNLRPTPPGRPVNLPSEDEDDEYARGLPPLKLKIPSSTPGLNIPFSPSPTGTTTMQPNTLPFPRTISPPRSRTASMDTISGGGVQFQIKSPTPTRSGNSTPTRTESPRPPFPRTASTPVLLSNASSTANGAIILSNGKPLKSSLKSSSSSPNIPFPSQSLVPSRIYAEIAKKQQEERERERSLGGSVGASPQDTYPPDFALDFNATSNRHARAASAPALPSLTLTSSSSSSDGLDGSCPPTPSAPKAVHFPSSDDGALATIKFFKRSARPASLSVPGASGGEETETETDGEGYNSGPGSGYSGYNANVGWGQWGGGYMNPWDRYTAAKSNSTPSSSSSNGNGNSNSTLGVANGSGALRVPATSPLGPQGKLPQRQPAQQQQQQRKKVVVTKEEKRLVYEVDKATSSDVPRKDLGLFDNVFLDHIHLDAPSPSPSTSSVDGEQRKVTSLKGSLLVRNLAYEKHVSVRFTLDGWHTTSEVKAEYKESLEKLPGWIVGVLRGDRSVSKDENDYDETKPNPPAPAPPRNPQWDRFTFSIDLSDYARSRSLANRTLWMVVRFGVPGTVRVPLGVPLLSREFVPVSSSLSSLSHPPSHNSSSSSSSSTSGGSGTGGSSGGLGAPQLDVMSPSSPDLLSTLISGIAGSPDPSPASQAAYARGRDIVEEVLRKVRCCVGVGVGNEWWDNNGGGNFRVGFREREVLEVREGVEDVGDATTTATVTATSESANAKEGGATRQRRANAVSCPPMFSGNAPPPPPMSILDKSLSHSSLSPPQISASTSLDSASSSASSSNPSSSNPSLSVTSPSSSTTPPYGVAGVAGGHAGPSSQSGTPKPWPQRTPAATKAMAETTLERLKRLNLRNYAAPSVSSVGRVVAAPAAIVTVPITATTVRSAPSATSAASVVTGASGEKGEGATTLEVPKEGGRVGADGPPSRTSSVSSTSSWTSTASTSSRSGSGSGSGSGSETTPMTSPLCTPTSVRSSVWDAQGAAVGAGEVGEQKEEEKKEGKEKGGEKEGDGGVELEPSLGRVTPRPIPNADPSTILKKVEPSTSTNALHLTSPLLGAFMAGPGPSALLSGEGGYDPLDVGLMGTSPPFSMFGGSTSSSSVVGRSAAPARSVVFGWDPPSTSTSMKDSDTSSISSGTSGEDSAKTPTPSTIPLIATTKPSSLILESIREKNVSSPVRSSPGGSGRSSPVPGLIHSGLSSANVSAHFDGSTTNAASATAAKVPTRPTLVAATSNYTNLKEGKPGSGSDSGSASPSNSRSSGSGGSAGSHKGHHARRHHRGASSSSSSSKSGLLSPLPLTMTTTSPLQSPTSISPSHSFSGMPSASSGNGNMVGSGSRSNSLDDIRDPDSIYQAFVRQWCFASGPAPQQAGGFGSMNKETGERKKHAM